ncbi:MAG: carboxylating nicotinate-nucleotide diphosphorylase, partial [Verrucomicrobiae bacterium]|nr:carboxylating nicotinate-nucleotide diphosphorylase [Verrucomicrobiae bacterium]
TVTGPTRAILTGERTALNFLQRLSGIASQTRDYVRRATGPEGKASVRVLDTRKTTPGWRRLEKAAVRAGGGTNHRIGLYDAAMVKDNHLVAEHSLAALDAGVRAVREQFPEVAFVEVEADRLDQVREFLKLEGVDVILLDNMSLGDMRAAVALRNELAPGVQLEASGGVTLETIAAIAATGVDAVSVGALTHSVKAADLALDLESLDA